MTSTHRVAQQLTLSYELSMSERLELDSLRKENDLLKKLKAELFAKNKRDKYESDAVLRKQEKQIEKLLLEINALKIIHSGASLNKNKKNESLNSLSVKTNDQNVSWQTTVF